MEYAPPVNGDLGDPYRAYVTGSADPPVEGSIPPAAAIEHPMREILAVIVAAGIVPDGADLTQLNQAIAALIAANGVDLSQYFRAGVTQSAGPLQVQQPTGTPSASFTDNAHGTLRIGSYVDFGVKILTDNSLQKLAFQPGNDGDGMDLDPATKTVSLTGGWAAGAGFEVAGYESAPQAITYSSSLTLAHGLGAIPSKYEWELRCVTAQYGYAIGDRVRSVGGGAIGMSIAPDATNLFVRIGSALQVLDRATGTSYTITPANWQLVFRAWL